MCDCWDPVQWDWALGQSMGLATGLQCCLSHGVGCYSGLPRTLRSARILCTLHVSERCGTVVKQIPFDLIIVCNPCLYSHELCSFHFLLWNIVFNRAWNLWLKHRIKNMSSQKLIKKKGKKTKEERQKRSWKRSKGVIPMERVSVLSAFMASQNRIPWWIL